MSMKNCPEQTTRSDQKLAMRVSTVSIAVNIGLSVIKLIAGVIANSGAMISDAVHSASDVFSTFVVMIGVSMAAKKPDRDHPYGHERLECVAAVILAIVLAATGVGIGIKGLEKITAGSYEDLQIPGMLALFAAFVSIVVKEGMFQFTKQTAKKINSGALMADAWHHRSDALSSIGSFAGILGARMGMAVLDPIASVVICLFIEKAAIDIFIDAMDKMVDKACSDDEVEKMKEAVLEIEGIIAIDSMKTRLFGSKAYVDVEILMDGSITLAEAHETAENVHDMIEERFPSVKHCMVHVNPFAVDKMNIL